MLRFKEIESVRYDERGRQIVSRDLLKICRSKIPGGWIVVMTKEAGEAGVTFVPDPNHTWDGSSID